jgi:hypothetical protein
MKKLKIVVAILFVGLFIGYKFETVNAQSSTPPCLDSEVSVDTGNAYGSTGVKIRRFANVDTNVGSDITYVDSATDGASFTINTNGVYAISYYDGSVNDNLAISLNASTTTSATSLSGTNRLCLASIVNQAQGCSVIVILAIGDVVRAHRMTGGSSYSDSDIAARFIITKVR